MQLLTLLTFKVARQFFVQRIWYRLERLGLETVSRPTKISSWLGVCQNGFFEPDPDGNGGKSGLTGSRCLATPIIVSPTNHEYRPGRLMINALALVHASRVTAQCSEPTPQLRLLSVLCSLNGPNGRADLAEPAGVLSTVQSTNRHCQVSSAPIGMAVDSFQTFGSGGQKSAGSGCLPDVQHPAFPDFRTGFRHAPRPNQTFIKFQYHIFAQITK